MTELTDAVPIQFALTHFQDNIVNSVHSNARREMQENFQRRKQRGENTEFMKETKRECCLLRGRTACLTRSNARRYSSLLESTRKEEIGGPCFSVGPTSGPCLIRCNARRFSSRISDCLPSMDIQQDNLTADVPSFNPLHLLRKRLMRVILCRNKYDNSNQIMDQASPCKI
ncbi:hypothetical protein FCM35_KLT18613 [Carex littledalei]|uniref:Uncharacterized protein n=1 Tax=Carex littledalei TaxID=544730 RepID=A0A833RF48_9POAL|nr:hypothetical protein FCM35_KLT18613 [Carex littledalei]